MGNWVFRNFAQGVATPEVFFDQVFLVAADARSDMFADGFNPDAPRTIQERIQEQEDGTVLLKEDIPVWRCRYDNSEGGLTLNAEMAAGIPEEECKLNGGLAITKTVSIIRWTVMPMSTQLALTIYSPS